MTTSISARELFDQQKDRLALRWLAGLKGDKRMLEAVDTVTRRPSLAGYLNAIYPNKVQILAARNWPGWIHWTPGSAGRPSRNSCSSARWPW